MAHSKAQESYLTQHANLLKRVARQGYKNFGRGAVVISADRSGAEPSADFGISPHYLHACYLYSIVKHIWTRKNKKQQTETLNQLRSTLPLYDPSAEMVVVFLYLDGRIELYHTSFADHQVQLTAA